MSSCDRIGGMAPDPNAAARHRMVAEQIAARGIEDVRVLAAMDRIPRHRFVPACEVAAAYADHPVPIGNGQTISQPYIVALMLEALRIAPGMRVLEIGTGCGYVTALLAELGCEVYSIEIIPALEQAARERLAAMGYGDVHVRCGDGGDGWPEAAPFGGIIVSAAPAKVPPVLLAQVAEGGRLVIPLGGDHQELWVYQRAPDGFHGEQLCAVRFVPMTGATG